MQRTSSRADVNPSCEVQKADTDDIVAYNDTWVSRFLYESRIGLGVNFSLLVASTVFYALTIKLQLADDFYYHEVFRKTWLPTMIQLFKLTLTLDIAMNAIILLVLFPLSRVSRSTNYYWLIGVTCCVSMLTLICIPGDEMTIAIRTLTVVDFTRLSMKAIAFLIECAKSEKMFKESSMKSLLFYLMIPNFVYKTQYPRSPRVRWVKVLCHLWWCFIGLFLFMPAVTYIIVRYTRFDLLTDNFSTLLTKGLITIVTFCSGYVPTVYFFIYENFAGAHGELLRFPDLKFYGEIREIYAGRKMLKWMNNFVSTWLSTYVYIPLVQSGRSRLRAMQATITVSLLFHEVCAVYMFNVIIAPNLILGPVIAPLLFVISVKGKFSKFVIATLIGSVLTTYSANYPLEYYAWNYSSMTRLEEMSRIRLVPLYMTQLWTNFFARSSPLMPSQ